MKIQNVPVLGTVKLTFSFATALLDAKGKVRRNDRMDGSTVARSWQAGACTTPSWQRRGGIMIYGCRPIRTTCELFSLAEDGNWTPVIKASVTRLSWEEMPFSAVYGQKLALDKAFYHLDSINQPGFNLVTREARTMIWDAFWNNLARKDEQRMSAGLTGFVQSLKQGVKEYNAGQIELVKDEADGSSE